MKKQFQLLSRLFLPFFLKFLIFSFCFVFNLLFSQKSRSYKQVSGSLVLGHFLLRKLLEYRLNYLFRFPPLTAKLQGQLVFDSLNFPYTYSKSLLELYHGSGIVYVTKLRFDWELWSASIFGLCGLFLTQLSFTFFWNECNFFWNFLIPGKPNNLLVFSPIFRCCICFFLVSHWTFFCRWYVIYVVFVWFLKWFRFFCILIVIYWIINLFQKMVKFSVISSFLRVVVVYSDLSCCWMKPCWSVHPV